MGDNHFHGIIARLLFDTDLLSHRKLSEEYLRNYGKNHLYKKRHIIVYHKIIERGG